ncbi:hypothetical protein BLL52_0492 [Rhodoferax antarcticus ANT.BR]|uniref:Uncharacterized protein n=1 Tax=Rhodoferax antarcticus ANT.BR TaxID=1111071 RepID=A0A1Q8YJH1_9BURK|nr:hypothetical protein BLL52_0492 [Rhodoferax antarcticus ANT.BR]
MEHEHLWSIAKQLSVDRQHSCWLYASAHGGLSWRAGVSMKMLSSPYYLRAMRYCFLLMLC